MPSPPAPPPSRPWWASAVFYQVYPRSFCDGNGDGSGDLIGLRERLDHLAGLGVDAIWLSPFYRSPMADNGYDVSDPCDVDPLFGTLADFDALLAAAHERGIRVTIDIIPNHFSDRHPWFVQALADGPGSAARARFIFRPGRGPDGSEPPNNWPSSFGGPAWTRLSDGEWYLHLFAAEQPDLDWTNPEVEAEFERILRFWLDRGVDGFRVDVAHGMGKPDGLPDVDLAVLPFRRDDVAVPPVPGDLRWDQELAHEVHRMFRRVLDGYPGERMAVGEVWVADDGRLARYVRPDELNLAFNFALIVAPWGAEQFRVAICSSLAAMAGVGAPCTWVLSNHDVPRAATRYGGGARGVARARAAALVQLALPGAVYLYNGDELGLTNVILPDAALRDPVWARSGHTVRGRDGERVPLPWSGDRPPYGFSTADTTWLPMPDDWARLGALDQAGRPDSTLALFRAALRLRRTLFGVALNAVDPALSADDSAAEAGDSALGAGDPALDAGNAGLTWLDTPDGVLGYRWAGITVLLNSGDESVPLPDGEVLLASSPLAGGDPTADHSPAADHSPPGDPGPAGGAAVSRALLPPDTAVWLR